jgi:hypothetical protein
MVYKETRTFRSVERVGFGDEAEQPRMVLKERGTAA